MIVHRDNCPVHRGQVDICTCGALFRALTHIPDPIERLREGVNSEPARQGIKSLDKIGLKANSSDALDP